MGSARASDPGRRSACRFTVEIIAATSACNTAAAIPLAAAATSGHHAAAAIRLVTAATIDHHAAAAIPLVTAATSGHHAAAAIRLVTAAAVDHHAAAAIGGPGHPLTTIRQSVSARLHAVRLRWRQCPGPATAD